MTSLESTLLIILQILATSSVAAGLILIFQDELFIKKKKKKIQNKMIMDKIPNKIYQFMSIKTYFFKD